MSSKNITYGPSEQELISAGVTQLFFLILWFIIHSITCYSDCHFSLNVFDERVLVLLGQVLLFTNITYHPAGMPAAAELSLNIRVSTELFPAILLSYKMGEQLKEQQLLIPSLCWAGHMHFHNRYHSRKLQRVENSCTFPQHRTFKRCRATFAPHQLWSKLPLRQVCGCNCPWPHVSPPLVPAAETCPNRIVPDFAGICSTVLSAALPHAWYEEQEAAQ